MYSFVILPRHCAFEEMRHLFVSFALFFVVFAATREAYFSYRQRPAPKTVEGRRRWKRWPSSAAVCFYCWSLWMFCCTCSGNFNARWVEIGRCVVFALLAGRAMQRGALMLIVSCVASCVVTVRTVRSSTDRSIGPDSFIRIHVVFIHLDLRVRMCFSYFKYAFLFNLVGIPIFPL